MVDAATAGRLAAKWVEAWNRRDLESILAHYADGVRFTSPRVALVLGRADGALTSKEALAEYFGRALALAPELRFELIDVLAGVNGVTLYYRNHRGETVAEVMELNEDGRVIRAGVHYARNEHGPSPATKHRIDSES